VNNKLILVSQQLVCSKVLRIWRAASLVWSDLVTFLSIENHHLMQMYLN